MSASQWLADLRWAMNVMRARRWRRSLSRDQRSVFDVEIRPYLFNALGYETAIPVSYPEGFYQVRIEDLVRAIKSSAKPSPSRIAHARSVLRPEGL
jgi:hypothetical protein